MIFGKCKVCDEKDKRLADLQSQIKFLRSQMMPEESYRIPLVHMEADQVLSGSQRVTKIDPSQKDEYERLMQDRQAETTEREALLGGNY